jgi:hypothetical protein
MLKLINVRVHFLQKFGAVGVEDMGFFVCMFDFFVSLDSSDVMFESGVLDFSQWNA